MTEDVVARIVERCEPAEVWEVDVGLVADLYPDARRCLLVVTDGTRLRAPG